MTLADRVEQDHYNMLLERITAYMELRTLIP